jgi:uncharacterized protein YlxW (UPF0749 family)
MSDGDGKRMAFDWTINLSHIGFAVGLVGTVVLFVWSLRDEVRQAGVDLRQMVVELRSENKIQDQIIQQNSAAASSNKAEETTFRSEMRQSVAELSKLLTDIRIQSAKK